MSELPGVDMSSYGKCEDCPFIKASEAKISKQEELRDDIITMMMDDTATNKQMMFVKMFAESIGVHNLDDMDTKSLREAGGIVDEALVGSIVEIRESISDHRKGCMGSVTLTGLTPDGRRQFSAQVCASPRISSSNTEEAVKVRRERI